MEMLQNVGSELSTLLTSLQEFDFRTVLNDQAGGQVVANLFNFI